MGLLTQLEKTVKNAPMASQVLYEFEALTLFDGFLQLGNSK